jgi:hypothetical protein
MTWLSLTIRGHRTSEQRRCHEESQKLLHSSEPIWTPQSKAGLCSPKTNGLDGGHMKEQRSYRLG